MRLSSVHTPFSMKRAPNRKSGEKFKNHDGYIMVKCPKHPRRNNRGYVQEHRLIMEEHLGRKLKRKEQVHHKNEIRHDNRLENLQLCSGVKEHSLIHRPPRFCKICGAKHFGRGFCNKHYCEWYHREVYCKAANCQKCGK